MKNLLLPLLLCLSFSVRAQLFVDTAMYTPIELATDFFNGSCVDVLAAEHTGNPAQMTFLEGSQSGLGVNAGILMTTGC